MHAAEKMQQQTQGPRAGRIVVLESGSGPTDHSSWLTSPLWRSFIDRAEHIRTQPGHRPARVGGLGRHHVARGVIRCAWWRWFATGCEVGSTAIIRHNPGLIRIRPTPV